MSPFPNRGAIESFRPKPERERERAHSDVSELDGQWSVSRKTVAAWVAIVGAGLILAGWRFDDHQYLSALPLELGATVLLVLPLLWVERLFERRVEVSEEATRRRVGGVAEEVSAVSKRLEQTRQSLSDLQLQTSERLRQAAEADARLVEDAREDISFESITPIFRRAGELGAINDRGVRVVVPGQWERLRFRYVTEVRQSAGVDNFPFMKLSIEDAAGEEIGVAVNWKRTQTPADALVELAESWKRAGSYPGDHAMDAEWIFGRLLTSLEVAIRGRRTRGDWQLNPLIELVSTNWAMTDFGLEHVPDPYEIPANELADDDELNDWRRHMGEKIWVDRENSAAKEARDADFWMVTQVAHQFFRRQLATG